MPDLITNIFKNSFYADTAALPKWNFDVSFIFHETDADTKESSEDAHARCAEYGEFLSSAVNTVKIPDHKIETLLTYLPGLQYAFPSKPGLNGEITLTFNDDANLTIRQIADYLMQYNYNPRYQQHKCFDDGTETYVSIAHQLLADLGKNYIIAPKFDILVRIYNSENEYLQKVIYKNCFVKSLGGLNLDYASEEVVTTTVTISYPYFKVLSKYDDESIYDRDT